MPAEEMPDSTVVVVLYPAGGADTGAVEVVILPVGVHSGRLCFARLMMWPAAAPYAPTATSFPVFRCLLPLACCILTSAHPPTHTSPALIASGQCIHISLRLHSDFTWMLLQVRVTTAQPPGAPTLVARGSARAKRLLRLPGGTVIDGCEVRGPGICGQCKATLRPSCLRAVRTYAAWTKGAPLQLRRRRPLQVYALPRETVPSGPAGDAHSCDELVVDELLVEADDGDDECVICLCDAKQVTLCPFCDRLLAPVPCCIRLWAEAARWGRTRRLGQSRLTAACCRWPCCRAGTSACATRVWPRSSAAQCAGAISHRGC